MFTLVMVKVIVMGVILSNDVLYNYDDISLYYFIQ